jgi:hypothetical protein
MADACAHDSRTCCWSLVTFGNTLPTLAEDAKRKEGHHVRLA